MKWVSRRTGLSAHVIRVWEKRYSAVTPTRTEANRRRYSEQDVARLDLLRRLTEQGHSIGTIAALPDKKLLELAESGSRAEATRGTVLASPSVTARPDVAARFLEDCLATVKALDAVTMEKVLNQAVIALGSQGLLQKVIAPLAQAIGDCWRDGSITAAHEHFASAVIRTFLGHAAKSFVEADGAPCLVVATPPGQLHELGALLVAATAANLGWRVTYLGAALPAAEIAGAVRQNRARAVALSLVYPADDSRLESELIRLRQLLPTEVPLMIGGRAAPAYQSAIDRIAARRIVDLKQLSAELDALRVPRGDTPK